MSRYLALFKSVHFVIKGEKVCEVNKIPHIIVPVPKEISSECGMSIKIKPEHKDLLKEKLNAKHIDVTFAEVK